MHLQTYQTQINKIRIHNTIYKRQDYKHFLYHSKNKQFLCNALVEDQNEFWINLFHEGQFLPIVFAWMFVFLISSRK